MKTPTLDKITSVHDKSQSIGEFLDWLQNEKKFVLASYHQHNKHCYDEDKELICDCMENYLCSEHVNIETLLADYFEIDLNEAEKERQTILKELQDKA